MSVDPPNPPFSGIHLREIPPTESIRYGALGSGAWRALGNDLWTVRNVQSVPALSALTDSIVVGKYFLRPRNPSQQVVWQIVAPPSGGGYTVDSFKVQFWRVSPITRESDGKLIALSLEMDDEVTQTISSGGSTLVYEQDHFQTDWCMAFVTAITLGAGSLPMPAGGGLTVLYKSQ